MKKLWFLVSLVTCGILLTWCFEKVEQNPEIIDDCVTVDWEDKCSIDIEEPVVEEPEIIEPEVKKANSEIDNTWWDWTNTSESNNYYTHRAKIVRTWNIYDYKNEEYGFQLTLPESWNDCMIAHNQSVNNETNKIEYESFQLICPWENVWNNVRSYIPEWYSDLVDIIVIWPDTDEWTLNSVSDQKLIVNNKFKFWFGISDASKDIFDWKISSSDLECWRYPNCTCLKKESYQVWDFWDKVPNNYQEIGCFITNIVKDHIEVFDIN